VTKYPHIGLEDAKTHLHDMLGPAYRDFTEKGSRANLVKVAEAAWAIHERLWHDNGRVPPPLTQFREDLFTACPELRLMRDIAETAKHAGLRRETVVLVSITGSEYAGGTSEITGSWLADQPTSQPRCTLMIETINGTNYPAPEALKAVIDFWVATLK
jgi:hypothetical protein